jgi:hypothetical protein
MGNIMSRDLDRRKLSNLSNRIERTIALHAIAVDNPDYSDQERQEMAKSIRDARREILNLLSTQEVVELKKRALQPERAAEIIRDEPEVWPEIRKALNASHNKRVLESYQNLYIAEKGYSIPMGPGYGPEAIAEYQRVGKLKKFEFPTLRRAGTATISDAAFNHRPDLRKENL